MIIIHYLKNTNRYLMVNYFCNLTVNLQTKSILHFSTETNLQLLKKSNVWMADGTFHSSPKEFAQVYIIYCNSFDITIPAIYVLMKSKTENVYKIIFDKIKELINIGPKMFIIDFETSVYNAMSKVFPEVEIRGCNFHFNQ
ncbi:hypothetical protein DMUE_3880, partial [Dictyocoela muelleri]